MTAENHAPGENRKKPFGREANPAVFKVLYDLAICMTADRSLEDTLQLVVTNARGLLSADTSYIALRSNGEVRMHTLSGIRTEAFMNMKVPYGAGLGGLVAKSRRGYIVRNYFTDPNIPTRVVDDVVSTEGLISGMAAPIQMGEENLGVLYVFNRNRTDFTELDLDILFLIANLAAVAISHHRAENELMALRDDLEAKVSARTMELAIINEKLIIEIAEKQKTEVERQSLEEKLAQSQKMEALGRLAGGIAHDFNNLLTAIIGYSEIAQTRLFPGDPLVETISQIQAAGEHAARLTNQLLAFSRKQILKPSLVDLPKTLSGTKGMLGRILGEDIEMEISLGENIPQVRLDPTQIQQVLFNLAANARDAMPNGGKLSIAITSFEPGEDDMLATPGNRYVLIKVADTGHGMDEQTRSRIFDPFFTTKELGKGTGLGLATVHGIVGQSGGAIKVASEPGLGTEFRIYFPAEDGIGEKEIPTETKPLPFSEANVLVVEDDDQVRELTCETLRNLGYRAVAVPSGEEALKLLSDYSRKIDLLLTDVVMRGMSGRILSERALALRPGLKVLFMSGYTEDAVLRHGITRDSISFVQKPFVKGSLAIAISRILAK